MTTRLRIIWGFLFFDLFSKQMLSDYDFGCDNMFSVPSKMVSFFQEGKPSVSGKDSQLK